MGQETIADESSGILHDSSKSSGILHDSSNRVAERLHELYAAAPSMIITIVRLHDKMDVTDPERERLRELIDAVLDERQLEGMRETIVGEEAIRAIRAKQ